MSGYFKALTDAEWDDIHEEACVRMEIDNKVFLAYRQFNTIADCYGPFLPLNTANDWEKAILGLRQTRQKHDLCAEVEVIPSTTRKVSASLYGLLVLTCSSEY